MPWLLVIQKKQWYQYWSVRVGVVLLIVGVLAGPRLKRRYDRWSAKSSVEQAKDYLAKGDFKHAILSAQKAIKVNPADGEAVRIIAQSIQATGAPGVAQWRMHLDSILPGDPENLLAWAKDALRENDLATAERLTGRLKPADQNNALYHEIAAELATRRRDMAGAESHWAEASRLAPKEINYRMNLAQIRLNSKVPGVREGALDVLREMAQQTPRNLAAFRALVGDALRQGEGLAVKRMADTLADDPGATFPDKLSRLTILRILKLDAATAYLIELRDAAVSKPADLSQLLGWMNTNDLSMMVTEWVPTLPPEIVSKPPICLIVAKAYMNSSEWAGLRKMIENGNWMELDYLRRAFLARTLDHFGEADAGAAQWKDALAAALSSPDALQRLEILARAATGWRWRERTEEAQWKMSGYSGCPRSALDSLWAIALRRGDTANLQTLSGIMTKANPGDFLLQNNYIFLSLLTRSQEGNPQKATAALYKQHADHPSVAATYALSLYQQGMAKEAVAVMSALKPEELRAPQVALYYGIVLTGAGHAGKALEFLELGANYPMLPEEKSLLARVKAADSKEENAGVQRAPDISDVVAPPDNVRTEGKVAR